MEKNKNGKILVIDDNQKNLDLAEDILSDEGYNVFLAENGEVGLQLAQEQQPDVILLDIMMPGIDGFEVCRRLKTPGSGLEAIKVIMLTAKDSADDVVKGLSCGAEDYVPKPYKSVELLARVKTQLELRNTQKNIQKLLEETLSGSIKVLTDILALVNPTAFSRAARMKRYVRHIAKQCKLSDIWQYELAAMLSHIGCVTLPQDIIEKIYAGQELSKEEQKMFSSHPSIGKELLAKIPRLENVSDMIAIQQEPFSRKHSIEEPCNRDIAALGGQILKVAIDYDSLTIHGIPHKKALEKLRSKPHVYNPKIVATLDSLLDFHVEMEVKTIQIDKLYHGIILDEDFLVDGVLVLAKGLELTFPVMERLRRFVEVRGSLKPIRVLVPREETNIIK